MESDNPSSTLTRPPPLNSDQLNYLIWRYLQEAGYGDAAVNLQRDWNVDPEHLAFAHHIQGRALIDLVRKGLRYHHLELTHGQSSRQLNPSQYYFGPESERPIREVRENARPSSSGPQTSSPPPILPLKRDAVSQGVSEPSPQPAQKKGRKTAAVPGERNGSLGRKAAPTSSTLVTNIELNAPNGYPSSHTVSSRDPRSPSVTEPPGPEDIAAAINGVHGEDRMEVDTDGEQPDGPTEPVLSHTLDIGESRATQVELVSAKVTDLAPSTTIQELDETSRISQILWHPTEPKTLAARADLFCGAWTLASSQQGAPNAFQDLIRFPAADQTLVTAMAWDPHGNTLAVAVASSSGGEVHLYDGIQLGLLETLSASQRTIMRLEWQKDGTKLIALAPVNEESSGSSILLWDFSNPSHTSFHDMTVPELLEDIDCAVFDNQFAVCASGGRAVYHLRAYPELAVEQKWSAPQSATNETWSFVKCSLQAPNDSLIVAASTESGRVWLPARELIHDAHEAPITALQLRPRIINRRPTLSTTDFATCSMTGVIKAFRYIQAQNSLQTLCKLKLGAGQPLKALAYSPDGFCLAGASYTDVRIWNAEHEYNLMASWADSTARWAGKAIKDRDNNEAVNGDGPRSEHSLSWYSDSMQLAFSLGPQLAIMNFQRNET